MAAGAIGSAHPVSCDVSPRSGLFRIGEASTLVGRKNRWVSIGARKRFHRDHPIAETSPFPAIQAMTHKPVRPGYACLLLALATVLPCPSAHAAHYRLFVLTGQSNSLGTTNAGEADPSPGTDPADAHVSFFWQNWVNATTPLGDSGGVFTKLQSQQGGAYPGSATHWGPEISFGRTLYRAGVRNFGIIKCSRGGGGNSLWYKSATDRHMYDHVVDAVKTATATLTAAGDTFEIVGLLYLQGESDTPAEAGIADSRIKELTDNLRADLPHASAMHCVIGGIAAAGTTRDTVRAKQSLAADTHDYIDDFGNLDLRASTAPDNLHFDKAAKLTLGGRYARAFLSAGIVSRHYGKLVFIGDSITQGGNGDHPSYRYQVFRHLAENGVPINAAAGYRFTGSQTGAYANSAITAPDVNGQAFENVHEGHYGWRTFWANARIPLPAGRYNANNLGNGTLPNWTGQSATYATADRATLPYTGTTYVPDTACIMTGINDLADDNGSANQVIADIGLLVDQLRAGNPLVRIHISRILHTDQTQAMRDAVDAVNAQLQDLADAKNASSPGSPVWITDTDTGFDPVTMTYDKVHPNPIGEAHVGDRIAAALGITGEYPMPGNPGEPMIRKDSSAFPSRFEGNEIWGGGGFANGWSQSGNITKSLPADTDLKLVNPGAGGAWIEGTNTGWNTANNASWTFETRLKFDANPNGFILWLGNDTDTILVEINGDRTQNSGGGTFSSAHNNLDAAFHTFRVANDAANSKYHVWRDGIRLTPPDGADYDSPNNDSRMILGDFTSGNFGNNFSATIDYVRFDQTGAYLPRTNNGIPFSTGAIQTGREIPRFGEHMVLEIPVIVESGGTGSLSGISLDLRESSPGNVAAWSIRSGGTFDPASPPLAQTGGGGGTWSPALDLPLSAGVNRIYLSAAPARRGTLGSSIDATVESLTLSGSRSGEIIPDTTDPPGALTLGLTPLFTDVRSSGQDGVATYRIPGIACDTDGILHAVFDHRYAGGNDLPADIDVGYARSTDGGATWSGHRVILDFDSSVAGSSGNGVGDPSILHDPVTDTLWVASLWSFGNRGYSGSGAGTSPSQTGQYVLTRSTDAGQTWSGPINITVPVKDDVNWRLVLQGPGHGLAMRDGTLVFPSQRINAAGTVQSCFVFSPDHGITWDFGSAVPDSSPQTNEVTACELDDGRLLFSMRTPSGSNGRRAWAHFTPGGAAPLRDGTWGSLYRLASVPDPVCQGSVIQCTSTLRGDPREFIVFGNPASGSSRVNFTLRLSPDGGATWPVSRLLYPGSSAYSSLCILPDRSIGVLFEKDDYTRITFARVEAEWLMDPDRDLDGDRIPDAWETLHGLDPASDDSTLDPDRDGTGNLSEYLAGTDPLSAASALRSMGFSKGSGGWDYTWQAVPGKSYSIETSGDLSNWTRVAETVADSPLMSVSVPVPGGTGQLFIRASAMP